MFKPNSNFAHFVTRFYSWFWQKAMVGVSSHITSLTFHIVILVKDPRELGVI